MPPPFRARLIAAALVAGLCALIVAGARPAFAHAVLESTNPAQGQQLSTLPPEVTLTFGEAVTAGDASLRVLDSHARRVDDGAVTHPGGAGSQVAVGLPAGLPHGSYTVVWRAISADSHPVAGTFSFGYGVPAGSAAATARGGSALVGWLNGIARFLGYAGLALALGVVAVTWLVWPGALSDRRTRLVLAAGLGAIALSALSLFFLAGPYDAGSPLSQVFSGNEIRETLRTRYGRLVLLRFALVLLAALTWAVRPSGRSRRPRLDVTALTVITLCTLALAEHTGSGIQAPLAAGLDALHLAAVAIWVGGLALLAVVLLRREALPALALREILPRWSRLALGCVAVIIGTGAYLTWREVGTWAALPDTAYGRLVLIKIGLLVGLIGLGAYGRSWVQQHSAEAANRSTFALRRSVGAEVLFSTATLGMAALLVNSQPGRDSYNPAVTRTITAQGINPGDRLEVSVRVSSTRPGRTDVQVAVRDPAGRPQPYAAVSALLTEPQKGLGPIRFTLPASASGGGTARGVVVPEPGHWQLTLQIRTGATSDDAASTTYLVR